MAVRRSAIPVSVDLAESAVHLWEFLKLIDNYPWLYEGLHVHNAVRRYEKIWLPLAARVDPDYLLSAPLDIEWVWYVHMLSPYAYHRDCLHRFGKVIHHRIVPTKERNIGLNYAREIWEKSYRNEPFSLDLTAPPNISETFTSKFSYDLFSAISRQRFFNYQVAFKHYRDGKFIERAEKRYRDFLRAKLQDPGLVLNGCFDVQLIWHVHMAHPVMYRDDTRKVFGEMLSHYDTEAGSGIVAWNASPSRKESTSAPKSIPGAMYRGEALVCTAEKILLTQKQSELTFKVKLLKEEFQHTVAIGQSQRSRDLTLTPCWFNLPSLTLDCSSHVINITNGKSDKVYNVKVTHSLAPILSTVEVIHPKDYLIATAHTIAGKQIPMRSQLDDLRHSCCAYTPEAKERALLIHSQKDWGVCVGKWVGSNESGQLIVSFFNIERNEWQTVNRSDTSNAETTVYEVNVFDEEKSVFINLATGMVTVPCNNAATFIPEIVALAYSIAVLYVLCRERTREFYPIDPFQTTEQKSLQPCQLSKQIKASRTTKRDGVFSTGSMGKKSLWLNRDPFVSNLLLATGRNCPWAPSNSFLRFFHDNVTRVFEQCTVTSDGRSSVEAIHEIEYLLEFLGVKGKSPKESKQKKRGSHDKGSQKIGHGEALKAAKDRFSNIQLNDTMDEMFDDRRDERDGRKKMETRDEIRDARKKEKRDEMSNGRKKERDEMRDEWTEERRDEMTNGGRKERRNEMRDGSREENRDEMRNGRREERRKEMRDEWKGERDEIRDGWRGERRNEMRNEWRGERRDEIRDEWRGERDEIRDGWRKERRNEMRDEWEGERDEIRDAWRGERRNEMKNEWRGEKDEIRDEWRGERDGIRDEWKGKRRNEMKDEWRGERDGIRDEWRGEKDGIRDEWKGKRRNEMRDERRGERDEIRDEWRGERRNEMRDEWKGERRDEMRGMRKGERKEEEGRDIGRRHDRRDGWWEDEREETRPKKTVHYSDQESYFI